MKIKNFKFALFLGMNTIIAQGALAKTFYLNQNKTSEASVNFQYNASDKELKINVALNSVDINDKDTFSELSFNGSRFIQKKGEPSLPVYRWEVEVPSEVIDLSVSAEKSLEWSMNSLGFKNAIRPALGPVEKKPGLYEKAYGFKGQVYAQNEFYPSQEASILSVGSVRGKLVALIQWAPIRWNPVTQQLKITKNATLKLKYGPSVVQKSIGNAGLGAFANSLDFKFSNEKEKVASKMLVIVGDIYATNQDLIDYLNNKAARGIAIDMKTKSQAGKTPAKIRDFIKSTYQQGLGALEALSYVLIVGDVDQVPVYDNGSEVTDNYYAAIDKKSYDEDIMYPDLGVGRFAISSNDELTLLIGKINRYEQNVQQRLDWSKRIAWLATDDRYEVAEGTHNYVIDTYTKKLNYEGIFPTPQTLGGDKLYAITHHAKTNDVMKSINEGRAIISYSGHGAGTYWDAPRVEEQNLASISNNSAHPYVMSHACITGSFGGKIGDDSFGEMWIKAPNGASAFWGASNNSYWDEDDILEKTFFDGMYKNNMNVVSDLNLFGMAGVRKDFGDGKSGPYYYQIYNLLGDPSMSLIVNK